MEKVIEQRGYFAFFSSYFESIEALPKKYQRDVYRAICLYCLKGIQDESLSGVPLSLFISLKPALDKNWQRSKNATRYKGRKSETQGNANQTTNGIGTNGKQTVSEYQTNDNQTPSKSGYNKGYIINPNTISSFQTGKANIKGNGNPMIMQDNSPGKYNSEIKMVESWNKN